MFVRPSVRSESACANSLKRIAHISTSAIVIRIHDELNLVVRVRRTATPAAKICSTIEMTSRMRSTIIPNHKGTNFPVFQVCGASGR